LGRAKTAKKDDPDYTQLCGYVPKDVVRQFKTLCVALDLNQSEGVEKALIFWIEKHNDGAQMVVSTPAYPSIAQRVASSSISELSKSSGIPPGRLNALASGAEPELHELSLLEPALGISLEQLYEVYKRDFPDGNTH